MNKSFNTVKKKVVTEVIDFTALELSELLEKEKPKEIWHGQWSNKMPFIIITEYNSEGFLMFCNARAVEDRKPEQSDAYKLYNFLRFQGLGDCYIKTES